MDGGPPGSPRRRDRAYVARPHRLTSTRVPMTTARADRLDRPVDPERDHLLGGRTPEVVLVEYGSYVCPYCHAAHEVVAELRSRFGDRMRYVYRHLPLADRAEARRAAVIAEYVAAHTGDFWAIHDTLMTRGPNFALVKSGWYE